MGESETSPRPALFRYWGLAIPAVIFVVPQWLRLFYIHNHPSAADSYQGIELLMLNFPALMLLSVFKLDKLDLKMWQLPLMSVVLYYGIPYGAYRLAKWMWLRLPWRGNVV